MESLNLSSSEMKAVVHELCRTHSPLNVLAAVGLSVTVFANHAVANGNPVFKRTLPMFAKALSFFILQWDTLLHLDAANHLQSSTPQPTHPAPTTYV